MGYPSPSSGRKWNTRSGTESGPCCAGSVPTCMRTSDRAYSNFPPETRHTLIDDASTIRPMHMAVATRYTAGTGPF